MQITNMLSEIFLEIHFAAITTTKLCCFYSPKIKISMHVFSKLTDILFYKILRCLRDSTISKTYWKTKVPATVLAILILHLFSIKIICLIIRQFSCIAPKKHQLGLQITKTNKYFSRNADSLVIT